ncbi:MAG: 30S ribosome-binding factor RbfA [Alphaproteobacteria bacterium]|nr:MAG: 30S ribosome-binding factor RbfA [Alphaproteobacteria bacterium]
MKRRTRGARPNLRLLRVGEAIRHAMAEIFRREEIDDDDLRGVSVTVSEVEVSPDLRHARVFVTPLGGHDEVETVKALNRHRRFLRGKLAPFMTTKYLPELNFRLDERFDAAERVEHLLRSERVRSDLEKPDEGKEE